MKDVVERHVPDGETIDEKIWELRTDLFEEEQRKNKLMFFNMRGTPCE
jgi:hypothetical protein